MLPSTHSITPGFLTKQVECLTHPCFKIGSQNAANSDNYLVRPEIYQDSKENTHLDRGTASTHRRWMLADRNDEASASERERERDRYVHAGSISHLSELPVPLTTTPPAHTQDYGGGPWQSVPSTCTLS